jgi:hypothetical protein
MIKPREDMSVPTNLVVDGVVRSQTLSWPWIELGPYSLWSVFVADEASLALLGASK